MAWEIGETEVECGGGWEEKGLAGVLLLLLEELLLSEGWRSCGGGGR